MEREGGDFLTHYTIKISKIRAQTQTLLLSHNLIQNAS